MVTLYHWDLPAPRGRRRLAQPRHRGRLRSTPPCHERYADRALGRSTSPTWRRSTAMPSASTPGRTMNFDAICGPPPAARPRRAAIGCAGRRHERRPCQQPLGPARTTRLTSAPPSSSTRSERRLHRGDAARPLPLDIIRSSSRGSDGDTSISPSISTVSSTQPARVAANLDPESDNPSSSSTWGYDPRLRLARRPRRTARVADHPPRTAPRCRRSSSPSPAALRRRPRRRRGRRPASPPRAHPVRGRHRDPAGRRRPRLLHLVADGQLRGPGFSQRRPGARRLRDLERTPKKSFTGSRICAGRLQGSGHRLIRCAQPLLAADWSPPTQHAQTEARDSPHGLRRTAAEPLEHRRSTLGSAT